MTVLKDAIAPSKSVVRRVNAEYRESSTRFFFYFPAINEDLFCIPDYRVEEALIDITEKFNLPRSEKLKNDTIEELQDGKNIVIGSVVTGACAFYSIPIPQKQGRGFKS